MTIQATHTAAHAMAKVMPPPAYFEPALAETDTVPEEYLPFTVRQVGNQNDLDRAIRLRHLAYSRHLPEFAEALKEPEADDRADDAIILLAESKLDGSPIGTVRIQTNLYAPLNVEHSIALPDWLAGKSIAEVRRLAVAPGSAGRLVKMVLIKAVYLYCRHNHLDWILVAARPPLDRTYEQLTLRDILDGRSFIPLPRDNNVPHRVLGGPIADLPARFTAVKHPLHDFFFVARHPDIDPSCYIPLSREGQALRPGMSKAATAQLSGIN